MKTAILMIALIIIGTTSNATASGINASVSEANGNTIISCVPNDKHGDIKKARIFLYIAEEDEIFFATGIQEMDVSYENVASYELPGTYDQVKGTCKFITINGQSKVSRQQFAVSMR